jgi:hypothetical protein
MIAKRLLMLFGGLWCTLASAAVLPSEIDKATAYRYLNALRSQAGLVTFQRRIALEIAAQNHAQYLSANDVAGHIEDPELDCFTGREPADRALLAGYESKAVSENLSVGQPNAKHSIDGLMGAIYHRFSFLDFLKDELGIGISADQDGFRFVYKMGSRDLNQFCHRAVQQQEIPFYDDVCGNLPRVAAQVYDQLKNEILQKKPLIIVWPPENGVDLPVAFYDETPDPLPDHAVSGYPISVQLNPFFFRSADLVSFRLFTADGIEVLPVQIMTRRTDPNRLFTETQFALFPLVRLDWDTVYRAEAVLKANGNNIRQEWSFRTRKLPHPVFTIAARDDSLSVRPGRWYAIHIPPTPTHPLIEDLRWETRPGVLTDVSWEDGNTVFVRLYGRFCDGVRFVLNDQRFFHLYLSLQEGPRSETERYSCTVQSIKDLPGYRIEGRGETLDMVPGLEYWVEIASSGPDETEVAWRYSDGMNVAVEHIDRNIFKIKLNGSAGQKATFYLSDYRSFSIVLSQPVE